MKVTSTLLLDGKGIFKLATCPSETTKMRKTAMNKNEGFILLGCKQTDLVTNQFRHPLLWRRGGLIFK